MEESRVEEIFERLEELDIELDYDPIERGPKFLNNMVAKCRNYTTEVQRYMRECQMFIRTVERQLRVAEAQFELEYNDLMANDPEIVQMRGLSRADREALANTKLQDQINEINDLKLALTDAKHVETVIDSKLREFRDVNRDIRLQKRLIEDEIQTGAMWGNDMGEYDPQQITAEDIDVEEGDMFENPDTDPETAGKEEPDYDNLFTYSEENSDQALDKQDQDDTVEDTDTDQNVSEDTDEDYDSGVFVDDSDVGELDFNAALESLG